MAEKKKKFFLKGLLILLAIIGVALVGVLLFVFIYARGIIQQETQHQKSLSNEERAQELNLTLLTQDQATLLATETFQMINDFRQYKGIAPLENSPELCSYLQEELQQVTIWADQTQLSRLYGQSIQDAFKDDILRQSNYRFVMGGISTSSDPKDIAQNWLSTSSTSGKELLLTSEGKSACIVATPLVISLIVAGQ